MGVFTTQTLLNSVGVSRSQSAPGAVAINWILKVRMAFVNLILASNLISFSNSSFVGRLTCYYPFFFYRD